MWPRQAAPRIRDIQGAAHLSPLNGQSVSAVPGIVTGVRSNGFYLQDPNPDANVATSEGIFVFTEQRADGQRWPVRAGGRHACRSSAQVAAMACRT